MSIKIEYDNTYLDNLTNNLNIKRVKDFDELNSVINGTTNYPLGSIILPEKSGGALVKFDDCLEFASSQKYNYLGLGRQLNAGLGLPVVSYCYLMDDISIGIGKNKGINSNSTTVKDAIHGDLKYGYYAYNNPNNTIAIYKVTPPPSKPVSPPNSLNNGNILTTTSISIPKNGVPIVKAAVVEEEVPIVTLASEQSSSTTMIINIILVVLLLLGGIGWGLFYLFKNKSK